jgi:hypothetical protein
MSDHYSLIAEGRPPLIDFDSNRLVIEEQPTRFTTYSKGEYFIQDPRSRVHRQREIIRDNLDRGVLPRLGNGYSFVIDQRPEGQEDDYIPPVEYTGYFSRRQIPIAAKGHRLRDHDIDHVPSYQDMFTSSDLADLVQSAATKALATPELCEEFTGAMDGLGDCMRNMQNTDQPFMGDIRGARWNIDKLVRLHLGMGEDGTHLDRFPLADQVACSVGLDWLRLNASDSRPGFDYADSIEEPPLRRIGSGAIFIANH